VGDFVGDIMGRLPWCMLNNSKRPGGNSNLTEDGKEVRPIKVTKPEDAGNELNTLITATTIDHKESIGRQTYRPVQDPNTHRR
jgi:hypothetical protein